MTRALWTAPRLWPGETAVVLATGPSLTQSAVDLCRGRARVIAVNNAYQYAPWADVLYACDRRWWAYHAAAVSSFAGLKVTGWLKQSGPSPTDLPDVLCMLLSSEPRIDDGPRGFDPDPGTLRHGSNSAHQAVHLAAHFGVARILLLGLDLQEIDGRKHFFGDHPPALNQGINFPLFIEAFERIAPRLKERGIEVINCTAGSALTCFPYQPIAEALRGHSGATDEPDGALRRDLQERAVSHGKAALSG